MNIDDLIFEPITDYFQHGNEIQICRTNYKGIDITWRTFFPYNFMKDPIDSFLVDIIVSMNTIIDGAFINDNYYTEEGYGYPQFSVLEHAISYIDKIKNNK